MLNIKSCCQLWQKPKIKRKFSKIQLCVRLEVKCALRRNQSHSIQFPISWEENLVNVLRLPLSTAFSLGQDYLPNGILNASGMRAFFSKRKGKMDSFSILIFTWDWTRAKFPITIFDASPLLRIRCSNFELWDGSFFILRWELEEKDIRTLNFEMEVFNFEMEVFNFEMEVRRIRYSNFELWNGSF